MGRDDQMLVLAKRNSRSLALRSVDHGRQPFGELAVPAFSSSAVTGSAVEGNQASPRLTKDRNKGSKLIGAGHISPQGKVSQNLPNRSPGNRLRGALAAWVVCRLFPALVPPVPYARARPAHVSHTACVITHPCCNSSSDAQVRLGSCHSIATRTIRLAFPPWVVGDGGRGSWRSEEKKAFNQQDRRHEVFKDLAVAAMTLAWLSTLTAAPMRLVPSEALVPTARQIQHR